jgi:hypothetical protein
MLGTSEGKQIPLRQLPQSGRSLKAAAGASPSDSDNARLTLPQHSNCPRTLAAWFTCMVGISDS